MRWIIGSVANLMKKEGLFPKGTVCFDRSHRESFFRGQLRKLLKNHRRYEHRHMGPIIRLRSHLNLDAPSDIGMILGAFPNRRIEKQKTHAVFHIRINRKRPFPSDQQRNKKLLQFGEEHFLNPVSSSLRKLLDFASRRTFFPSLL